jgi:hypothetical protein
MMGQHTFAYFIATMARGAIAILTFDCNLEVSIGLLPKM